jgi:hypothetical protein
MRGRTGFGITSPIPGWTAAAAGDLMELNGWSSPQMLRRYGASAPQRPRPPTYDRIMENRP